jgi:hypothetical protein
MFLTPACLDILRKISRSPKNGGNKFKRGLVKNLSLKGVNDKMPVFRKEAGIDSFWGPWVYGSMGL